MFAAGIFLERTNERPNRPTLPKNRGGEQSRPVELFTPMRSWSAVARSRIDDHLRTDEQHLPCLMNTQKLAGKALTGEQLRTCKTGELIPKTSALLASGR
jgi:hypothetical protein